MRICLTCPPGGHLDELMSIMDAFKGHDLFIVTRHARTSGKLKGIQRIYYVKNLPKPSLLGIYISSLFYCVYILLPCIKILFDERPDVIMGCGGEENLIMSYLGKIMGVRVIYIESLARVNDLSISGKFILNIADLFLVQWRGLAHRYKNAQYWGKVI